jgi:RND family efflux transporter MFP subunit
LQRFAAAKRAGKPSHPRRLRNARRKAQSSASAIRISTRANEKPTLPAKQIGCAAVDRVVKLEQLRKPDAVTRLKAVTERPDRTMRLPIVLAVLATALCGNTALAQKSEPAGSPAAAAAAEVRAHLVSLHSATLSSEMAGRIDGIATRIGDRFKKGDVLVSFDCAMPRTQVARAQAVLTQVERTYEINRRSATQKPTGQLELDIAAADVLKAKADLAAAEAVTSKCSVTAPFAGVTVDRKVHEFEYATPGQPLLDVLDDHALEVEVTAPSRALGWLKPGASFQLRIDDTGKTYSGRVTRLGGRVDPASHSVKVIGEITGDAPELMAGMSGRATVTPP